VCECVGRERARARERERERQRECTSERMCMYIYIYVCVCVYVFVYMYACMCGCVCVRVNVCVVLSKLLGGVVCITRQVCVRACMYAISYTHTLADSKQKGRCIKRHDTSGNTTATRTNAMSAGAHTYDDNAFFEFITLPYPQLTHTQAHTQQAFGKGVVEPASMLPMACLLPSNRSTCEQRRAYAYVSVRAYKSA